MALGSRLWGERENSGRDVGIPGDLIGTRVMLAVFVMPPAITQATQQGSLNQRGPLIGLARNEDLPVRGIMGQERQLGRNDRQYRSQQQLEPRISQQTEADAEENQTQRSKHHLGPVVAISP